MGIFTFSYQTYSLPLIVFFVNYNLNGNLCVANDTLGGNVFLTPFSLLP